MKVERDEADKHELNRGRAQKGGRHIDLLSSLGPRKAEVLREGNPPHEIARDEFERMRVRRVDHANDMPGDVF